MKKASQIQEWRGMTVADLEYQVDQMRHALCSLRLGQASQQDPAYGVKSGELKASIARALTILHEKKHQDSGKA